MFLILNLWIAHKAIWLISNGNHFKTILAQKKQNSINSIIDYHRRTLKLYKLYTLIPNNLDSHTSNAQQWTSTSVNARPGMPGMMTKLLNIYETNMIITAN